MAKKKQTQNYTEIKSVEWLPLAKIMAIFSAILGLLFGLAAIESLRVVAFITAVIPGLSSLSSLALLLGLEGATLALLPILTAVIAAIQGFVTGFLTALIYNFVAKRIGGIKIQI